MRKSLFCVLTALLLTAACAGCDNILANSNMPGQTEATEATTVQTEPPPPPSFPVWVADAIIYEPPEKVISLSPSLTEIMYDMGYDYYLSGVSSYCDYPESIDENMPRCGTAMNPLFEAIDGAGAQVVFSSTEFSEANLIKLQQRGIEVVVLPAATNFDELCALYVSIATVFEGTTDGAEAGQRHYRRMFEMIRPELDAVREYVGDAQWLVASYVAIPDFYIAGGDTIISDILRELCLANIAEDYSNWYFPEQARENYNPGVVFVDMEQNLAKLANRTGFVTTDATKNLQWWNVDTVAIERQGKRMFLQMAQMARDVYPKAFD